MGENHVFISAYTHLLWIQLAMAVLEGDTVTTIWVEGSRTAEHGIKWDCIVSL